MDEIDQLIIRTCKKSDVDVKKRLRSIHRRFFFPASDSDLAYHTMLDRMVRLAEKLELGSLRDFHGFVVRNTNWGLITEKDSIDTQYFLYYRNLFRFASARELLGYKTPSKFLRSR